MSSLGHRLLGDPRRPDSFVGRLRGERWAMLVERFPDLAELSVLDVGGEPLMWQESPLRPASLTVVNLYPFDRLPEDLEVEAVVGDACALEDVFGARRFDLVYSNSVLEHVGGHLQRQRMAEGIRAIGAHHWVQTPYRYFPIEPHWWFPGFQFLPVTARAWVARHWSMVPTNSVGKTKEEAVEAVQEVELLSEAQLRSYFPTSTILHERLGGLTKSLIAVA